MGKNIATGYDSNQRLTFSLCRDISKASGAKKSYADKALGSPMDSK